MACGLSLVKSEPLEVLTWKEGPTTAHGTKERKKVFSTIIQRLVIIYKRKVSAGQQLTGVLILTRRDLWISNSNRLSETMRFVGKESRVVRYKCPKKRSRSGQSYPCSTPFFFRAMDCGLTRVADCSDLQWSQK